MRAQKYGEGAAKRPQRRAAASQSPPSDTLGLKKGPCANRKRTRKRDRLRGAKMGDRLLSGGRDKALRG